jgi:hypothetical protein
MPRSLKAFVLATALLIPVRDADAQSLSSLINELFTYGDCGQPLCLVLTGPDSVHQGHFIPAVTQGTQSVLGFLSQSIGRTTANLPISATSSGVTFKIVDGLPVKTSTSAGPIFAERSQTLGKGRFFVGANVSGISFSSLNSAPLADLRFNFAASGCRGARPGRPDSRERPDHDQALAECRSAGSGRSSGRGDILDFRGHRVAIPVVRVSLSGTSVSQITPFGSVTTHRFGGSTADPQLEASKTVSGSASGFGDIAAGSRSTRPGRPSRRGPSHRHPPSDGPRGRLPRQRLDLDQGARDHGAQIDNVAPHLNIGYAARSAEIENDGIWPRSASTAW